MRICFTHDIFRAPCGAGDAGRNGRWLHGLLGPILSSLGHDVRRHAGLDQAGIAHAARGGHLFWARTFSDPAMLPCLERACASLRHADFVIGFEMTPNQLRFLARAGVPFLDISIDPLRFAPDLFLRMRTSDPGMARTLEACHWPRGALHGEMELLRGSIARAAPRGGQRSPAVLFIGQTDVDASLVCGGALATVAPFIDRIGRMLAGGTRLVLKPHPYGQTHSSIRTLRAAFPSAAIVNDNVYALINLPCVTHVVTISSGVAQEARLFEKLATTLITPDHAWGCLGSGRPLREYRIGQDALMPSFWRFLGGDGPLRLCRRPISPGGVLRRSVGQSWGYDPHPRLYQRRLVPGRVMSFGVDGDGLALCTFGWSRPEPGGLWSEGACATMLVDGGGDPLDLVLDCRAFAPTGHAPLEVGIRAGAATPQRFTFSGRRRRKIVVRLPAASSLIEVEWRFSGIVRPRDAGIGDDMRKIGVQLVRGVVRRPPAAMPAVVDGLSRRLGQGARAAAAILVAVFGAG